MPNTFFDNTDRLEVGNHMSGSGFGHAIEDGLDETGRAHNTIYFNMDTELARCINEIYHRGYELASFPREIEAGDFWVEWADQDDVTRYSYRAKAVLKWTPDRRVAYQIQNIIRDVH